MRKFKIMVVRKGCNRGGSDRDFTSNLIGGCLHLVKAILFEKENFVNIVCLQRLKIAQLRKILMSQRTRYG